MLNDKKNLLKWLKDENAVTSSDNFIDAEKAFFVNSVFIWCTEEIKKGTMTAGQVENCMHTLRRFLKGRLDLCWDSGIIKVRKKGRKNASNSMANTDGK
tara:strand:- start:678 stop:974 length:297 start_codon:yes stop_codon:yes gene_type:complete